jgi:hypothetical protein
MKNSLLLYPLWLVTPDNVLSRLKKGQIIFLFLNCLQNCLLKFTPVLNVSKDLCSKVKGMSKKTCPCPHPQDL